MKTTRLISSAAALAMAVCMAESCDIFGFKEGTSFIELHFNEIPGINPTKSTGEIPDTNDFILKVTDSQGEIVFDGRFGDSPERMEVSPGSYIIEVISAEFKNPGFDSPQYGDNKVVLVGEGQTINVGLECRQLNAGVRLRPSPEFMEAYPAGKLFLESQNGSLEYQYSEKRIAYFNPGGISLVLTDNGERTALMARNLERCEILSVDLTIGLDKGAAGQSLDISLDTTRNWVSETIIVGEQQEKGKDKHSAYSVSEAKLHTGEKNVWVYGYIVGGDLSSSKISFTPPFSSNTNIAIASRSAISEKSSCFSVQLQKGSIRDALNLVDNADLIGHQVFLRGDIVEAYFGIPGMQNLKEFELN